MNLKTSEIIYDEKIYPREKVDMNIVAQYRDAIENLPNIVVDKKNRVIDGYHRLLAYRGENVDEIEVEIFESEDDGECLLESIKRNAKHGKQLTSIEKKTLARNLYKQSRTEVEIKQVLSISERTISDYLKDMKAKEDESRDQKILELYLACRTQEEIAQEVKLSREWINKEITKLCEQMASLPELHIAPTSLQYTNLWEFNSCDPEFGEKSYPGRMPGQIIENLLWYYTQPFDVVLDPMGGGGTKVDVCKKMYRRYMAYDLNPIETKGIKQNDITKGFPARKIRDKPKLIVLDPPYSIQKKGEYTKHENDLSNQDLDGFYKSIKLLALECKKEIDTEGIIAYIISSLKTNGQVIDLAIDSRNIFTEKGFEVIERVCVPYNNATSMTGYWITDAKKNKRMLRAYRDLLIMRVK